MALGPSLVVIRSGPAAAAATRVSDGSAEWQHFPTSKHFTSNSPSNRPNRSILRRELLCSVCHRHLKIERACCSGWREPTLGRVPRNIKEAPDASPLSPSKAFHPLHRHPILTGDSPIALSFFWCSSLSHLLFHLRDSSPPDYRVDRRSRFSIRLPFALPISVESLRPPST